MKDEAVSCVGLCETERDYLGIFLNLNKSSVKGTLLLPSLAVPTTKNEYLNGQRPVLPCAWNPTDGVGGCWRMYCFALAPDFFPRCDKHSGIYMRPSLPHILDVYTA